MEQAATHILQTAWRLVPANPILTRVVYGQSRRVRHLWLRIGYLGILFVVMGTVVLARHGSATNTSLNDLAKIYSGVFESVSMVQLALMCFLAPIFTAAAITQERDAQTYNILLTTPMSNAQIVLGSLLSRLYFVIMLLLSGLPIFCITMIYGGVTFPVIFRSFAIAGATAVITGSIAITYSVIRVGTKKTIFTFYLLIGLYLLGVWVIGNTSAMEVAAAPANTTGQRMSWLAWCHPFLALDVALNRVGAPELGEVARYGWPLKYFVAYPDTSYVVVTLLLSILLAAFGMFFVRRGAKEGETTLGTQMSDLFRRIMRTPERRAPKTVWNNPIAWREAETTTSMAGSVAIRYAYFGLGVLAAVILLILFLTGNLGAGQVGADITRSWLLGLVTVEFSIVLLIATNMAASAMTRERESNAMDILLSTPLTPKDLISGKLRGLVTFALPLIAVPIVTCIIFAAAELIRPNIKPTILPEGVIYMSVLMVVYVALACILGLHRSIQSRKTVNAVLSSVAILVLVCFASFGCWFSVLDGAGTIGAILAPFTPFTTLAVCIDPLNSLGLEVTSFNPGGPTVNPAQTAEQLRQARMLALFGSAGAAVIYSLVVVGLYNSMVKHFDMTVRKQSV